MNDKSLIQELQNEVLKRNRLCQKNKGSIYTFDPFGKDPFTFKNVNEYKNNVKFTLDKCTAPIFNRDTDKSGRYYPRIPSKVACNIVAGVWDKDAIKRSSKHHKGVCWLSEKDAKCGAHLQGESPKELNNSKTQCRSDKECSWVKFSKSHDCISKQSKGKSRRIKVVDPPSNMPLDITSPKNKIEDFLYDWYSGKKDVAPPKTSQLIGHGNRCVLNADKTNTITSRNKSRTWKKLSVEELKELNPTKQHDAYLLIEALGPKQFEIYENLYKRRREAKYSFEKQKLYPYWIDENDESMYDDYQSALYPSVPQSVVNMVSKQIAKTGSTNRGLLVWHSTGSGKTCTATGVMDAFWDTTKKIIFTSSIDAIASNPDYKFHECAMNLYPRFQQGEFKGEKDVVLENISNAFTKRGVRFLSFAKLANRLQKTAQLIKLLGTHIKAKKQNASKPSKKNGNPEQSIQEIINNLDEKTLKTILKQAKITDWNDIIDLNNTVLIIDEVHNLFRPLPNQKQKYKFLEEQLVDVNKFPHLKVVILTATPGDNITDIMKLLNIVRDPTHTEITSPDVNDAASIENFKNSIRGTVSYFDMSSDLTKFPKLVNNQFNKTFMSETQFSKYIEAYKSVNQSMTDFDSLVKKNQLNKFWQGPRKYSNMLFKMEKGMQLTEFSSKLPALLEIITKQPSEKHYVYSSFYENRGSSQGIREIARQLEAIGYEKLTYDQAKKINKLNQQLNPKKRFILAIQSEITSKSSKTTSGENLHEMIRIFNSEDNKKGEIIHVFLASQGFNEGIDLKAVRHIHIFEPLITMASDQQTIGRARRYCSHAQLDRDKGEWDVNIHRYFSEIPIIINNDENIENDISHITNELDKMKGKRGASFKGKRDLLKEELKLMKKQQKEQSKQGVFVDIKNIDDFIFKEAQNKMKDLLVIHMAIKEAAIDCKLLQKFHSTDQNNKIACAF